MHKVCNDVLNFTGMPVTTTQLYNHLRKWNMICLIRDGGDGGWCQESTSIMISDDERLMKYHG
jgi:hypothetical protein